MFYMFETGSYPVKEVKLHKLEQCKQHQEQNMFLVLFGWLTN